MEIQKINYAQPNFRGKVYAYNGPWSTLLKTEFEKNKALNQLANSADVNIEGRLIHKNASSTSYKHLPGSDIYKVKVKVTKTNPGFIGKIRSLLHINKGFSITKHYHSEDTIISALKSLTLEKLAKKI